METNFKCELSKLVLGIPEIYYIIWLNTFLVIKVKLVSHGMQLKNYIYSNHHLQTLVIKCIYVTDVLIRVFIRRRRILMTGNWLCNHILMKLMTLNTCFFLFSLTEKATLASVCKEVGLSLLKMLY